jgi:hypothetical protein
VEVGFLNFELAAGTYLKRKILATLNDIVLIDNACEKLGLTEKNPLDNYGIFRVPVKNKHVVVLKNKIAVIDGNPKEGFYNYDGRYIWQSYDFNGADLGSMGKTAVQRVRSALRIASYYLDFSDNVPGRKSNEKVQRPNLAWYKENGFDIRQFAGPERLQSLGDSRDPGYIFSLQCIAGNTLAQEPDYVKHYTEIANFLYDVKEAKQALTA